MGWEREWGRVARGWAHALSPPLESPLPHVYVDVEASVSCDTLHLCMCWFWLFVCVCVWCVCVLLMCLLVKDTLGVKCYL